MASPAKKRKLNNSSKNTSTPPRNLDYFFGKQKQQPPEQPANNAPEKLDPDDSHMLTDEQFARKLQAEADLEAAAERAEASRSRTPQSKDSLPSIERAAKETSPPSEDAQRDRAGSKGNGAENVVDTKHSQNITSPKGKHHTLTLQASGSEEYTILSTIPLDESPLTFEPSKYAQNLAEGVLEGRDASYALLTRCFVLLNNTRSRIRIVDTLVNLLRVVIEGDPSSLLPTVRMNILFSLGPVDSLTIGL